MSFDELPWLEALARRFANREAAIAEIAHLEAVLTLPKGTVHVVSDVHGEYKKLSHVIRNASGSLRVLIDRLFADLAEDERSLILRTVYYCEATWSHLGLDSKSDDERNAFFFTMLARLLTIARALATTWSDRAVDRVPPPAYRLLFRELFSLSAGTRPDDDGRYLRALVEPFLSRGIAKDLLRLTSRVARNLSVYELIVAGDLGDRGPRLDKVIEVISKQPRLAIANGCRRRSSGVGRAHRLPRDGEFVATGNVTADSVFQAVTAYEMHRSARWQSFKAPAAVSPGLGSPRRGVAWQPRRRVSLIASFSFWMASALKHSMGPWIIPLGRSLIC